MQKYSPGKVFHKLTIIEEVEPPENHGYGRSKFWKCVCECGNEIVKSSTYFRTVKFASCGCDTKRYQTTHGMTKTPEFVLWQGIVARCYNKNSKAYPNYGGRGITMCEEWREDFQAFYNDMGPRPSGKELDRIDNSEGYSKENCRWVSKTENLRNTRRNVLVEYNGKTYVLTALAELLGMSSSTLTYRLKHSLPLDKPIGRWK